MNILYKSKFKVKKIGYIYLTINILLFIIFIYILLICATHDFEYIEGVFHRAIVFSEDHKIIRDDKYENVIKILSNLFLRIYFKITDV